MCLKQRRGRGRKYLEEKLVLRLRRPRRPRIDGRVSQKVRGVSALSNWWPLSGAREECWGPLQKLL
jgi:hypothetical protein